MGIKQNKDYVLLLAEYQISILNPFLLRSPETELYSTCALKFKS